MTGVGMEDFLQKHILERGDRRGVRECQNIGLLWGKVPMFCLKSTDVYAQEVRCFLNPGLICFLQIYDEDLYAVGRARTESPKGT